jgi:hypothetical protein
MENKLKGGYDDDEFDREAACENNIEDFISIVYVNFSPRMKTGYYFRTFHDKKECKNDWSVGIYEGNKNMSYGNYIGPITFKDESEKQLIFNNIASNHQSSKKIIDAARDMYDFYKDKDLTKRKFPITYTQYKKEILTPTESARDYQIIKHYTGFKNCELDPKRPGYCATNNSAGGRRKKSVRKSSRRVRKSRKQRKSTRRVRS